MPKFITEDSIRPLVAKLNRIATKVDRFRGPGVINEHTRMCISPRNTAKTRRGSTTEAAPGLVRCTLTKTSGTAGTKSTNPSWVYTATDPISGETLGTSLTPQWQRRNGKTVFGVRGIGFYEDGAFVLLIADERPATNGCTA